MERRLPGLWTLGPKAGPQRAKVQVSDARRIPALTLRATAQPGPAAKLAFIAPARSGIAGRNLGPVRVEAIDAHGNPVPGQSVVFSVHTGSVEAAEVRTDERGAARTLWTLGPAPGDQVLTATASGTDLQASLTVAAAVARPSSVKKPKAKP